MKPSDIALALTVPVLWGFGFVIAKPAMAHFPPLLLMAMTYGVTAVCLCRRIPAIRTPFLSMVCLGLLVATIQAGLIFYALADLPASTAVLILQSSVPFSVLFAWPLAGERPRGRTRSDVSPRPCWSMGNGPSSPAPHGAIGRPSRPSRSWGSLRPIRSATGCCAAIAWSR